MPSLPFRRIIVAVVAVLAVGTGSVAASTYAYLRVPAPTGDFVVGRVATVWSDSARAEVHTADPHDRRHVRVVAWYPAEPGTGHETTYLEDLDAIADGLVASGEIGRLEVAGLRFVRSTVRSGGSPTRAGAPFPLVVLSPGNATNVEFYAALAEELASHGFIVLGIDHPWQVAAVALPGGVAVLAPDDPSRPRDEQLSAKTDQRVADIRFVLDRLHSRPAELRALVETADLGRVGVIGHSNGGIAAAQACEADARIAACANVDGQHAGGPFSSRPEPVAPTKPFMFLTKERDLHPRLADLFDEAGPGTYRVVVPEALHDQFADGARFRPRLLPVDGPADRVLIVARGFALAFFDHELRGAPRTVFGTVDAQTDVLVEVYPLRASRP